jgi:Transposase DDE domain
MKTKRHSTVEPVWGTLINFTAMKRINVRGITAANKCLIMAAACYNLKKWMKFITQDSNAKLKALNKEASRSFCNILSLLINAFTSHFKPALIFFHQRQNTNRYQ